MLELETDTQVTHWWMDVIRGFLAFIDKIVYWLLMIMYEVFFNIADSTIFSSETINEFYQRVQLIIGVFMIFKVSVSLIQAVMDPDRLTNKDTGMGKIITRIITMLAMFTAIIPLNIPYAEEGSYNAYLNENGLLFGTLYSLQSRVLSNNVLGKLIVGNVSSNTTNTSEAANDVTGNDKEQSAKELATFVLKTFVRINLKEDATEDGAEDRTNFMCYPDTEDGEEAEYINTYMSKDATPSEILNNINDWCNGPNGHDDNYTFVYTPIISTVCGLAFVIVLLGYCIDIAVRALKLAVLRLLAPIPIISYIDPKSSKDGSFAAWVKTLTSTYLDLFLRLAIIFFVLFLVQAIIDDGLELPIGNGTIGLISTVFILIGMFYFAKMAPKFIKDALGLKGNMSNFGLSGMMAAAGAIKAGGNALDAVSSAQDAMNTQVAAFNQGKQGPGLGQNFTSGSDYMAKELTGDSNMTYSQMKRGRRYLDREGLTASRVENEKSEMFRLKDEAEKAKSLADYVNNNGFDSLSNDEKIRLEAEYRKRHNIANGPMTAAQIDNMKQYAAVESYNEAQSDAGRQEAKYNDMQKEMEKRGGARNSYRSKHSDSIGRDARVSDLLTHEGREAMRTGSFRETMRNVASIPQNERQARIDQRNANHNQSIDQRQDITEQTNQRLNDSRENRNNP